jgi:hypothetical protein
MSLVSGKRDTVFVYFSVTDSLQENSLVYLQLCCAVRDLESWLRRGCTVQSITIICISKADYAIKSWAVRRNMKLMVLS